MYRWWVQKPISMRIEKMLFVSLLIVVALGLIAFLNMNSDNFLSYRLLYIFDNFDSIFAFTSNVGFVTMDGMGEASTQLRIISTIQTLIAFISRPLFGFSLGSVICHGSTVVLLTDIGIIGTYFWVKFNFHCIPLKAELIPAKKLYAICVLLYLIINMLNSMGLRPFYDFSLTLFVIGMIFLFSINKESVSEVNN